MVWMWLFWFGISGGQLLISPHCKRFRVLFYFPSVVAFVLVLRSTPALFVEDVSS